MIYVIIFIAGLVYGTGVGAWYTAKRQARADVHHYSAQWSSEDREAVTAENAVLIMKVKEYKQKWMIVREIAKDQAALLMASRHAPIALAPVGIERPVVQTRVKPDRPRPYGSINWDYGARLKRLFGPAWDDDMDAASAA